MHYGQTEQRRMTVNSISFMMIDLDTWFPLTFSECAVSERVFMLVWNFPLYKFTIYLVSSKFMKNSFIWITRTLMKKNIWPCLYFDMNSITYETWQELTLSMNDSNIHTPLLLYDTVIGDMRNYDNICKRFTYSLLNSGKKKFTNHHWAH